VQNISIASTSSPLSTTPHEKPTHLSRDTTMLAVAIIRRSMVILSTPTFTPLHAHTLSQKIE